MHMPTLRSLPTVGVPPPNVREPCGERGGKRWVHVHLVRGGVHALVRAVVAVSHPEQDIEQFIRQRTRAGIDLLWIVPPLFPTGEQRSWDLVVPLPDGSPDIVIGPDDDVHNVFSAPLAVPELNDGQKADIARGLHSFESDPALSALVRGMGGGHLGAQTILFEGGLRCTGNIAHDRERYLRHLACEVGQVLPGMAPRWARAAHRLGHAIWRRITGADARDAQRRADFESEQGGDEA